MQDTLARPPLVLVRDNRAMLRVKVNSLAAEARIIRHEEQKARCSFLRQALYKHRILIVRRHARDAHLALGFIKGRTLEQMERKSLEKPNWVAIRAMIVKHGPKNFVFPDCFPK